MSKKKRKQTQKEIRIQPPARKRVSPATWIAVAAALVALTAFIILASGGAKDPATGAAAASTAGAATTAGSVPPEEQKYIGRLLPASYAEPPVSDAAAYSATLQMADVTVTQGKAQTSIPLADVVSNKIVFFQYQKAGGEQVPMIAYVKPSGKLFVGVSFCIPCKSIGQSIEADGTLRCKACGTKRDAETGVGISGACRLYPLDELPVKVTGGKIAIENAAVEQWTPQPLDRKVGA